MTGYNELIYQNDMRAKKNSSKLIIMRVVSVILLISLIFGFSKITSLFIDFLESYVVPDGVLASTTIFTIKSAFVLLIAFLVGVFVFSFPSVRLRVLRQINKFIDIEKIGHFFFSDEITRIKGLAKFIFFTGTAMGVFIHAYFLAFGLPVQEGFIETASSFLFLLSAFIIALASFYMNSDLFTLRRKIRIVLWIIVGVLLYIFGEEISWGQHFFKWESFGIFKEMNFQSETNTHNFFNPIFRYLYPAVTIGAFVILFFLWFFPRKQSYLVKLFVPHVSLFFLSVLIVAASILLEHEIFEELLAVFFLLYSIRIFVCLRFPAKDVLF